MQSERTVQKKSDSDPNAETGNRTPDRPPKSNNIEQGRDAKNEGLNRRPKSAGHSGGVQPSQGTGTSPKTAKDNPSSNKKNRAINHLSENLMEVDESVAVADLSAGTSGSKPGTVRKVINYFADKIKGSDKSESSVDLSKAENVNAGIAGDVLFVKSDPMFIVNKGTAPPPTDPLDRKTAQDFMCTDIEVKQQYTEKKYVVCPTIIWKLPTIPRGTWFANLYLHVTTSQQEAVKPISFQHLSTSHRFGRKEIICGKLYCCNISFDVCSERYYVHCITPCQFRAIPAQPKNLILTPYETYSYLTWSACEGATKINVKVSQASGDLLKVFETNGNATYHNIPYDEKIMMGVTCVFEVISKHGELENFSMPLRKFIGDDNCPRSVKAVLIKATNKVKVSWDPPFAGVQSYKVKAECPGVKSLHESTPSREFEFEGLSAGSKYTFFVQAVFRLSKSYWIPSNSIATESCTIEVENFDAYLNPVDPGTSIICKWTKNENANHYKIKCSSDNHESVSVVTIGETFTIRNLYPDTKYKVKIRAKEVRGYGDFGAPVELLTAMGRISHPYISLINASRDAESAPGIRVQFVSSPFPLRKCKKKHIVELRTPGQDPISKPLDVYDEVKNEVKFDGLKHSTEYEAFIKSSCDGKLGEDVSAGKIITVPKIPEKVHCAMDENNPSDTFIIKWSGEPGCADYEIHVSCIDVESEAVLIPISEKMSHTYKCQNIGCAYNVKIRAFNASGYSAWSFPKWIITAPAAVDYVCMSFEEGKIVVSWEATRHTTKYDLDLFEVTDEDDTDLLDDEKNRSVHTKIVESKKEATQPIDEVLDDFQPRKGVIYQCRITTKNGSVIGLNKKSNKIISPLDPPTDITYKQKEDTVLLEWVPTAGMKKALIVVKQGDDDDYQDIVSENIWTSPPLPPDRHVEIRIYAKSSMVESAGFERKKFYTAPSQIVADLDPKYRSTHMNVDIKSETSRKCRVVVESLNGEHYDEFITTNLHCQVTNLHPATEYAVIVENISDDPNEICLNSPAERVTTDPLKVTGLNCEIVDEQRKLISWDSCGNDKIGYTLECRKDMLVTTTTSTETKILLESLEPGRYSFLVKGGQGDFSKPYNITVPKSPKFEFELVTPEQISVICSQVKHADSYEAEIWCEENRQDRIITIDGKFWIHYEFECGKRYLLKLYAVCKEHKSAVAKHYFYANLTAPTELTRELDDKQPSKKVRFTWKANQLAKKTHLKLFDTNGNVVGEMTTVEKEWEFGDLMPNRLYTLKAYPNDGVKSYANYAEVKFRTAPSKPDKLEIKKNLAHPTTKFDVEIQADYNGPFMILVRKADEEKGEEIQKDSKRFILDNMISGCPYYFFARCKFTDPVNKIVYYSAYTPFTGKK